MNSDIKPNKIKSLLDSAESRITPATLEKLRAARTQALNHQRTHTAPVLGWVYAHIGPASRYNLMRPLPMLFASALLAAFLISGATAYNNYIAEHDISEVDIAILTDDMPLHVFVD